jgi:hypothetical protein
VSVVMNATATPIETYQEEAVAVAEVLPIVPGWNYLVRLYQRTEVLDLP